MDFKFLMKRFFLIVLKCTVVICLLPARLLSQDAASTFGTTVDFYGDVRVSDPINTLLTYVEGTLGALVMTVFFISSIIFGAFGAIRKKRGQRIAAGLLLLAAVMTFLLRWAVFYFFNDSYIY